MPSEKYLTPEKIQKVLKYIDAYWPKITRFHPKDSGTLIGLPKPFIIPAEKFFEEQFYWDSYPVVKALLESKKHQNLAIGMVENLLYEVERFGFVPNASRMYFLSRSQPPFLSQMVWDVFDKTRDFKWFRRAIGYVEKEYENVWLSEDHPHHRKVHAGLSRYYDINISDELAMAESGWDNTVRFEQGALNILPVDLNCLLYQYERDLAKAFGLLEEFKKEEMYNKLARSRAKTIEELMWNEKSGFFFDFNFAKLKQVPVITVAGLFPMIAGFARNDQVKKMVSVVEKVLECDWGIVQSEKFQKGLQWDYPNGWPLQQYLIVEGLIKYGYDDLAATLIKKWLAVNIKVFEQSEQLWEKYDVVSGEIGVPDRYPTQSGFGWTNACFLLLLKKMENLGATLDKENPSVDAIHPSSSVPLT